MEYSIRIYQLRLGKHGLTKSGKFTRTNLIASIMNHFLVTLPKSQVDAY
jgi:hypothetical protein